MIDPAKIRMLEQSHVFRFAMVGGTGFLTEALVIWLGTTFLGMGVIAVRVPSFILAVLVTWYLNRSYTFDMAHKTFRESFPPYVAANSVGLGLNFLSYTAAALVFPVMQQWPILLLAVGSLVGMGFNFCAAKFFIFKKHD